MEEVKAEEEEHVGAGEEDGARDGGFVWRAGHRHQTAAV